MCGIAGIVHPDQEKASEAIQSMNHAQAHRGPDDDGAEFMPASDGWLGLGHRRLAIIDVSPAGHQPMLDPDTGNWITFNGEIYNFLELRRDLERMGSVFRTKTDTEVILKAYAQWGTGCVSRMRGIFAFGLWDARRNKLFLARDHLGVKPLYYLHRNNNFAFASEVRALLASDLAPRKLDLHGLRSFLAYGSVQDPLTLIEGVQSLLPGHTLTFQNDKLQIDCYWRLPGPQSVQDKAPPNLIQQTRAQLEEAVGLQLVSDVPLGAFLSGGIDSTAIAALMCGRIAGSVNTFNIVFDEKAYDERLYARAAARYIGSNHTELLLTGDDVRRSLPEALAAYDQPSMDGLNTYFVSKAVRDAGMTVALSGVGGDELFGGYNRYSKALLMERWGRRARFLPSRLRSGLSGLLLRIAEKEVFRKAGNTLAYDRNPYFISRQVFGPMQVEQLLLPEVFDASTDWEPATFNQLESATSGFDPINRASALELQTYMLSTLLRDTDQMSMAHALEVRVPLIDHKLIEFLFTLPGRCKVDARQQKPLLVRPLEGLIPNECINRPKKGFELPFFVWLNKSLEQAMQESFSNVPPASCGPFNSKALGNILSQFRSNRVSWSRVWALFVLRNWMSRHGVS